MLSRTTKGQNLSLPVPGLDFRVTADQDAVLVTTYMPEAEFNVTYYKSVSLIPGATIKQAFQQASPVPFSLIVDDELADNEEAVDLSAEDFVDKLWLLSIEPERSESEYNLTRIKGAEVASPPEH